MVMIGSKNYAQSTNTNVNRIPLSSLHSFHQLPDAVSWGLGDGGVSNEDAMGFSSNVAKAFFLGRNKTGLSFNYAPHESRLIRGQKYMQLAGVTRIDTTTVIFYQIFNFKNLSSELRDENGILLGEQTGNDLNIKAGVTKHLGNNWVLGVGLGYYQSQVLSQSYRVAKGVTIDIGMTKSFLQYKDTLSSYYDYGTIGASISNFGGKVNYGDNKDYSFAPVRFRGGYTHTVRREDLKHKFMLEISKDLVPTPLKENYEDKGSFAYIFTSWADAPFKEEIQEIRWHLGYQLTYKEVFDARVGFLHENKYKGDKRALTFGLGYNGFKIDENPLKLDVGFGIRLGSGYTPTFKLALAFFFAKKEEYKEKRSGYGETF